MAVHKIKQGMTLPIVGEPKQLVDEARPPRRVAVIADDYHGMRPSMEVAVGDGVVRGQALFEDKRLPSVRHTSPASGKVVAVNRGDKRVFQSVVIELDDEEKSGRGKSARFAAHTGKHPSSLDAAAVRSLLLESGLWTALRARPFGRVAHPEDKPRSIFVTAMDSNPLAADAGVVMKDRGEDFERGLVALSKLTDGPIFVCTGENTAVQTPKDERFRVERFVGPHPSGTVGLHIHLLDPVGPGRMVWYTNYQDVIAIGKLFASGEIDPFRVVALGGPAVKNPRLLRTRLGASLDEILAGELEDGELRVISGSVFSGRKAMGEIDGYLGRYSQQISVLREGREREMLGWAMPGGNKFSAFKAFLSSLTPGKRFALDTSTNGSVRAIVPLGMYEKVFPFDMIPSYLLRSVVVGDIEMAEELGVLELEEEDVALCSFVCPGKIEYGAHLRQLLTTIEKEG